MQCTLKQYPLATYVGRDLVRIRNELLNVLISTQFSFIAPDVQIRRFEAFWSLKKGQWGFQGHR